MLWQIEDCSKNTFEISKTNPMKYLIIFAVLCLLGVGFSRLDFNPLQMKITSSAFQHNESIPAKYTCDGENINPDLKFEYIPSEAVSLALLVDDPDAPVGDWVHWLVFNMDAKTEGILEDSLPSSATSGLTDFQNHEYGGPCPPNGEHRYFFKLYALDTYLDLGPNTTKAEFLTAIDSHIIDQSVLIGLYDRR